MTVGDMLKTVVPKSDQMNAEDLMATGPQTFTITRVHVGDGDEQPVSIWFAEWSPRRPFKPSKTVRKILIGAWGGDSSAYVGKRITLFYDESISFGGQKVGGIRVSAMSGIPRQKTFVLALTKGRRAPHVIDPLPDGPPPSRQMALAAALQAGGHRTPAAMLAYCRSVVARPIKGAGDLTPAECDQVLEALAAVTSSAPTVADPAGVERPREPGEPSDAELEAAFEAEQARLAAEGADGG